MFSAISHKLEGGGRRKWNSALESFTSFYVFEQMKNLFFLRKKEEVEFYSWKFFSVFPVGKQWKCPSRGRVTSYGMNFIFLLEKGDI